MFAPPPHTSAASVITTPHSSVRDPANSTGGAYSRLILIAPNADPQNSTNSPNARTVKRRSASNDRPPRTHLRSTINPHRLLHPTGSDREFRIRDRVPRKENCQTEAQALELLDRFVKIVKGVEGWLASYDNALVSLRFL